MAVRKGRWKGLWKGLWKAVEGGGRRWKAVEGSGRGGGRLWKPTAAATRAEGWKAVICPGLSGFRTSQRASCRVSSLSKLPFRSWSGEASAGRERSQKGSGSLSAATETNTSEAAFTSVRSTARPCQSEAGSVSHRNIPPPRCQARDCPAAIGARAARN